jgi:hypothetical protein
MQSAWGVVKSVIREAWNVLRAVGRPVGRYASTVAGYYWSHRPAFREYLTEYASGLQSPQVRRREIRLSPNEDAPDSRIAKDGWHVDLPDCCAVCGEPADRDWSTETVEVPDVSWPIWSPIVALGAGFLLMLVARRPWLWPITFLAGFVIGYEYRNRQVVIIRYRRCEKHAGMLAIPHLRLFKEFLVIRVGHSSVRQKFYDARYTAARAPLESALSAPPAEPLTLPLEEDTSGASIEYDDRERLGGYPGESEGFPFRGSEPVASDAGGAKPLREFEPERVVPAEDDSSDSRETIPLVDDLNDAEGRPADSGEPVRCPSCGREVSVFDAHCPNCNARL